MQFKQMFYDSLNYAPIIYSPSSLELIREVGIQKSFYFIRFHPWDERYTVKIEDLYISISVKFSNHLLNKSKSLETLAILVQASRRSEDNEGDTEH